MRERDLRPLIIVTTVDCSRGSLSIAQMNASLLRTNSVICAPIRQRTSSGAARQHAWRDQGLCALKFGRGHRPTALGISCGPQLVGGKHRRPISESHGTPAKGLSAPYCRLDGGVESKLARCSGQCRTPSTGSSRWRTR